MPGGAPPKEFSDDQVIEMGKDLVNWLSNEGKESLYFLDWFFKKKGMFRDDWKALIQRKQFLPYYKIARQIMTDNMVRNDKIHHSYGHRYLARYDDEIHEHEEGILDREAERKSKETKEENLKLTFEQFQVLAKTLGFEAQPSGSIESLENHSSKCPSQDISLPLSLDQQ